MANINGKSVLFNEQILFSAGQQVDFPGAFPVRFTANPAGPLDTNMRFVNGVIEVVTDGYSGQVFDQIAFGNGTVKGQAVEYIIRGQFVSKVGGREIYQVAVTIYAV